MKIKINAAGCGDLLKGTGYNHGQCLEGNLNRTFAIVRVLFEHGLHVALTHPGVPLLEFHADGYGTTEHPPNSYVVINIMPVNWFELAGGQPAPDPPPRPTAFEMAEQIARNNLQGFDQAVGHYHAGHKLRALDEMVESEIRAHERHEKLQEKNVLHPGETVLEYLQSSLWARAVLATRTEIDPEVIADILDGKAPITETEARAFEKVFGRPAQFWLNLQSIYDQSKP